MFNECALLKELDLSNFNTSNVEYMTYMFSDCELLKKLDLSNFRTSKVQNMYKMFSGCTSLEELNLSGFKVSKNTDTELMFEKCVLLKNINTKNKRLNNEFKKTLILENLNNKQLNFDVADYTDDNNDLTDSQTIENAISKPKNYNEEESFFKKTIPSDESKEIAAQFIQQVKNVLNNLIGIKISDEILKENKNKFQLYGAFSIVSRFNNCNYLGNTYKYATIDLNHYTDNKLVLNIPNSFIYNLAQMIEFCQLYNNTLTFTFKGEFEHEHFNRCYDYFSEFQDMVKAKDAGITISQYIYQKEDFISPNPKENTRILFNWICEIYKLFNKFYFIYQKKLKNRDFIRYMYNK